MLPASIHNECDSFATVEGPIYKQEIPLLLPSQPLTEHYKQQECFTTFIRRANLKILKQYMAFIATPTCFVHRLYYKRTATNSVIAY